MTPSLRLRPLSLDIALLGGRDEKTVQAAVALGSDCNDLYARVRNKIAQGSWGSGSDSANRHVRDRTTLRRQSLTPNGPQDSGRVVRRWPDDEYVELAKRVTGIVRAPPCLRRFSCATLEEAGYIRGYHADVDPRILGFEVQVFPDGGSATARLRPISSHFEALCRDTGLRLVREVPHAKRRDRLHPEMRGAGYLSTFPEFP